MLDEFNLIISKLAYMSSEPEVLQESNNVQLFKELWLPIVVIFILIIIAIFVIQIQQLRILLAESKKERSDDLEKEKNTEAFDNLIEVAGFSYDSGQDMFYYNMDVWQRDMGYCRLYDEATAPLGMIIDCEPIYFEYNKEKWLIEFWKGQYDLVTGCEIGVYKAKVQDIDLDIEGFFNGTFYRCVDDKERLNMSFTLIKNGKILFERSAKHWWLTGFKLGEFSEPSELTMIIKIAFNDNNMCQAFIQGLMNAGYSGKEINKKGNTIILKFYKPHTAQPFTRTVETDRIIQGKNEWLCNKYNEIVGPYNSIEDKINAISEKSPEIYERILNIGNFKELVKIFNKIRGYLS